MSVLELSQKIAMLFFLAVAVALLGAFGFGVKRDSDSGLSAGLSIASADVVPGGIAESSFAESGCGTGGGAESSGGCESGGGGS